MGSKAAPAEGSDRRRGERYAQALAGLEASILSQRLAMLRDVLEEELTLWPALRHLVEQPGFEAARREPSAAMRELRRQAWLQDLASWCNQDSLARAGAFLEGLLQLPNSPGSDAVPDDQDPPPSQPTPSQPPPSERHNSNPPNDPATPEDPAPPATPPTGGSDSSGSSSPDTDVRRLRAQGLKASQRGEHQRAIDLFSQALRLEGGHAPIYLQRASVYAMAGNFDAAITDCNAVLKLQPGHLEALAQRGKAHAAQGRLEEAKQDWLEASQQGHPEARTWLARQHQSEVRNLRDRGIAARRRGDHQLAIALFTTALEIDDSHAELYRLRSESFARIGNLPMAVDDCSAALWLEPENADLMAMRGEFRYAMGDLDRARQDWEAALNRGHPGAKDRLARDCLKRAFDAESNNDPREVINLITKNIRFVSDMPVAYVGPAEQPRSAAVQLIPAAVSG
ncbi:MAG: tetratricopeptide repeat protein [Cyanobium sp.]